MRASRGRHAEIHSLDTAQTPKPPQSDRLRGLFSFEGTDIARLCITVIGRDADAIRRARAAAEADADLVELRLDSMERPEAAAALEGRTKPAIVTCRPLREGGMFDGAEDDRLRVLSDAHARGAEFIDLEWDAVRAPVMAERGGRGVVVSRHIFDCTPRNAAAMMDHLRGLGGEVAKL